MVRLADVCTRISDGTHQAPKWADNGVPFLFVSNIRNGRISFETNKFVSSKEYTALTKNNPIDAGDVLYTAVGSYGNSAVVPSGKTFIFQRHVAHLKPQHELVDSTYLAQMLETPAVRRQADKLARGVAQKTVTLSSLRDFEIPLPPLDEQKRIAAILNKADALRAKRRQAIVLLDSLTQSIFLEMFGDPVSNPKGWEVKSLAEFELFLTSGSRGWAEYYSEQGTPFIRIQNLKGGRLSTEDLVFVNAPENAEARRTRVESGDVLISITADLGRVAVVPAHVHQAANINQHIALFRPKGINPIFLSSYLASQGGKRQFAALNRQGVKAGLNFSNIRALKILNPPMEMQRKFEKLAKLVADREIGLSGSSVGTEALFTSLQHRAFSGQL
ncbi:restriction endonuclease subunit S [Rhizobium sp. YS-1r]|uniref:restriction endonuclease subunit S n=1 Tax=Rhizobium sp. YS-1r TaxID=1532558 RepID=UPI0009E056CD|nr:restriction endonuclease subunit S [Rhizobium sp. YS-1r]